MKLARRLSYCLASFAIAIGVGVSAAQSASAVGVDLWQDANRGGGHFGAGSRFSNYHGSTFDNGFHLWDALTSEQSCCGNVWTFFWENVGCSGFHWARPPDGNWYNIPSQWNDQVSAHAEEWATSGC